MGMDIRLPIGILFSIFGLMLIAFGMLGDASIYAKSLNININLWWGIVMVLFGVFMLGLAYYGRAHRSGRDERDSSATVGSGS